MDDSTITLIPTSYTRPKGVCILQEHPNIKDKKQNDMQEKQIHAP